MIRFACVVAAVLTTGCSQLLLPAHYPYASRLRVRPIAQEYLPKGRWDNVMRLQRGAAIDVLTRDGAANVGAFTGADSRAIRLEIDGIDTRIPRPEVVRIDLVDLPGADGVAVAKRAARGAALGVGAAALIAGVIGGEAWPPPGMLLRAGAAVGSISGGEAALIQRRRRLVYLAENP